ncbi:MAG: SprT-like domain-containing protein [Saprospiraceae bacterium]|nr:SprT-like domain-containing protein [Pyrinomonadaceae bacterium]
MPDGSSTLRGLYIEAFRTYDPKREIQEIDVRFYPYIGINHTIRVRDGKIFVRIAEMCRDMPPLEQQALAFILVSKLLRKKVPAGAREIYSEYIKTVEMREKATESKRSRGRKIISTDNGAVYHLGEIFEALNREYFWGNMSKPVLTWSARKTYRILGHHDSTHKTIVISKSLDSVNVPKYVVESVVFHEMLHIHHPTVHHNGRRYNHTPAFRRDEEKFEYFEEAERWIERNVRKLKKEAKRK